MEHPRAQAEPDEPLVEVAGGPVGKPGIDRVGEREQPLGDPAGRGDDHHHQHLRLQRQHLDVPDRRGLDRRRGDDRQQVRDLRQGLGGDPHRLVELAPHERQRQPWSRVIARAAAGRRSSGSRPRSGSARRRCAGWASRPSSSRLASSLRIVDGPHYDAGRQRLRAHGRAGREVFLHDLAQHQLLAIGQHDPDCRSGSSGDRSGNRSTECSRSVGSRRRIPRSPPVERRWSER